MISTPTPQAFVAKWRSIALHERDQAFERSIELCRLLNQPTPAEAAPARSRHVFEAGTTESIGGQSFAGAITHAARDPIMLRGAWLIPPDASEAGLSRRMQSHFYNARPAARPCT